MIKKVVVERDGQEKATSVLLLYSHQNKKTEIFAQTFRI